MKNENEIDSLRSQIRRLTGRAVVSRDPAYLRRRLEALSASGARATKKATRTAQCILTASMSPDARAATEDLAERVGMSTSAMVRLALHDLALKRGLKVIASRLED